MGPKDPINFGAIQTITGSTATLGQPQVNGVNAAVDYLDGKFDGIPGKLLDHSIKLTVQDETDPTSGQCGKAGGQTAATKLAADPTVVAVIGTSCSSSALGVADTTLGSKGIILVSSSNTSPVILVIGTSIAVAPSKCLSEKVGCNVRSIAPLQLAHSAPPVPVTFTV